MDYRHGDVTLTKIDELPADAKNNKKVDANVLAYGEVTGHSHRVVERQIDTVLFFTDAKGDSYMTVRDPVDLVHEEHQTLVIQPGTYVVGHEREHDWFSLSTRRVVD